MPARGGDCEGSSGVAVMAGEEEGVWVREGEALRVPVTQDDREYTPVAVGVDVAARSGVEESCRETLALIVAVAVAVGLAPL